MSQHVDPRCGDEQGVTGKRPPGIISKALATVCTDGADHRHPPSACADDTFLSLPSSLLERRRWVGEAGGVAAQHPSLTELSPTSSPVTATPGSLAWPSWISTKFWAPPRDPF